MKANVQMTVTSEGLRIELLEKEGGMFFDSGSAHISPNGREINPTRRQHPPAAGGEDIFGSLCSQRR
jgi:flagellar motor protein MotB